MSNLIHPTAIIGETVNLGQNNEIGPNVVIQGRITIGNNNIFGIGTHICNNVNIGNDNQFKSYVCVGENGEMGQKGEVFREDGCVIIGNNNIFREYSTIQSPVRNLITKIGNNSYFMARTHIPHDAQVGDYVTMATNSIIGGGCILGDYSYIGLGAITHQWLVIGESAMIGMHSCITKNVPPFTTVIGNPAKILSYNLEGMKRRGLGNEDLNLNNFKELLLNGIMIKDNQIQILILDFIKTYPKSIITFYK